MLTAGCDHCYAHALAHGRLSHRYLARAPVVESPENDRDPFAVRLWPERLRQPSKWREPRMIFVNSMSDLWHADIPTEFVRRVFRVMLEVDRHIYQVLTKRPARAARFVEQNIELFPSGMVPSHIWIGTSVERQRESYRIRQLRRLPAAIRFLSCEPLLGPLEPDLDGIHWVIAGGESGPGYRPLNLDWPRGIRDLCIARGVPFFFKQIGGLRPSSNGRRLDGRVWEQYPAVAADAPA